MDCRFRTVWKKSSAKVERVVAGCCLRLGLAQIFFGSPTALNRGFRQILGFKKLHEIRTVVGTGNFTGSWSPHSVQQRMSEGRERKDKMGGDDCAEQSVTNSATCRTRVIPASVALTPPPVLCHTLSCPVNDTVRVWPTKYRQ